MPSGGSIVLKPKQIKTLQHKQGFFFYAKKRRTGVCHLLNLAKDLIPAAHIWIKF